jgi:hypothetical protein
MKKQDLRLLMLATFRYSLGRRSYMPGFIVEMIMRHNKVFNGYDWEGFISEINVMEDIGDLCDIQTWNKLIHFSEDKLNDLKNLYSKTHETKNI